MSIGKLDRITCEGNGILVVDVYVRSGRDSTSVLDLQSIASIEVLEKGSNDVGTILGAVAISAVVSILLIGSTLSQIFEGS
ncbi:MAG: hypothetical protein R3E97_02340 [Candidatus Eisenbacteria bacterium]